MSDLKKRVKAYKFGLLAEFFVITLLKIKFYRILARRYKTKLGEIDIIAKRGRNIIFIEVKARNNFSEFSEIIKPVNQQRISRSAELFLIKHPKYRKLTIRFDVFFVTHKFKFKHIKNAW